MKVGIEVQRLFRKKKFGIESSSLELIRKLREVEPSHQYVIFAKDDHDMACLHASENLKIRTVAGKFFADFEQFFLPIAAGREQVDILHCTGNTAPYFCPVPVVQTLHDVIFMDSISAHDTPYQRFGNYYRRKVVPLITPRSKAIITVSEFEKNRIVKRLGIEPDRVQVIYNGLNEERFHLQQDPALRERVKRSYHLPEDFVLFLGNQAFRKNPGRVIEAYVRYASRTENPLALVAPGLSKGFVVQKLRELKFPYNRERFITPGYIADADLPTLYSMARIFLFPSLSEGFGMPIVEAQACGTPVITSAISCMPEIAGDAALLVDPFDADDMALAMERLAADDRLRQHNITAGLANAKRFSWNQAAEKVLHLYDAVYQQTKTAQKVPGFFGKYVFATRH